MLYRVFDLLRFSGVDGSRTRVRNTIPCPSTSVVYYLTFPLPHDNKQPCSFSSFMIRPMAQSFANVVSHIVEVWILKCECSRSDCCHHGQQVAAVRLQPLNYLQRLYLVPSFNVVPDHGWLPHVQNPRRNQYKPVLVLQTLFFDTGTQTDRPGAVKALFQLPYIVL